MGPAPDRPAGADHASPPFSSSRLADTAHHPKMGLGEFAPQYRAMVLFAGYVGLRPGELFALRAEDVRGQLCHISRSRSVKAKTIGPTKSGKSRTVTIPPVAQDALAALPSYPNGLLFNSPSGRPWTQVNHNRYFLKLQRLASFDLAFYELRHCAATMLLERGVTPWDVAIQLGHQDGGQLVTELYGHPREDTARSRLLAAWETPVSGANREQAVEHSPQALRLHP